MSQNADSFREMHRGPEVLVLANCWDAWSARLVEDLGARALATTSAGLAWSQGYPDGNALPISTLVATVRSIARSVRIPLTVDAEAGYSDDPVRVAENIVALADAGAVGINLEDGKGTPALLAAKIEAIKNALSRSGNDVFVNARTDVYLAELVGEERRVEETLSRATRYREAGADGFFVPKLVAPVAIRAITEAAGLPVNLLHWPGLGSTTELAALGVRRLSAGSALAQQAMNDFRSGAADFLREGRLEAPLGGGKTYADLQNLFSR